jgi:hypothetical protein
MTHDSGLAGLLPFLALDIARQAAATRAPPRMQNRKTAVRPGVVLFVLVAIVLAATGIFVAHEPWSGLWPTLRLRGAFTPPSRTFAASTQFRSAVEIAAALLALFQKQMFSMNDHRLGALHLRKDR